MFADRGNRSAVNDYDLAADIASTVANLKECVPDRSNYRFDTVETRVWYS